MCRLFWNSVYQIRLQIGLYTSSLSNEFLFDSLAHEHCALHRALHLAQLQSTVFSSGFHPRIGQVICICHYIHSHKKLANYRVLPKPCDHNIHKIFCYDYKILPNSRRRLDDKICRDELDQWIQCNVRTFSVTAAAGIGSSGSSSG